MPFIKLVTPGFLTRSIVSAFKFNFISSNRWAKPLFTTFLGYSAFASVVISIFMDIKLLLFKTYEFSVCTAILISSFSLIAVIS